MKTSRREGRARTPQLAVASRPASPLDAVVPAPMTVTTVTVKGQQQTAKKAREILLKRSAEYRVLTPARSGKVLYGDAFDIIRAPADVDFKSEASVLSAVDRVTVCEIKSTDKAKIGTDLRGYFFSLSTAELLSAQNLGANYRFVFVNVHGGDPIEMSLKELFAKARSIYPTWSVYF